MENKTVGDNTPTPEGSDDGLSGESAERRSPEWSGGHEAETASTDQADPENLPEHEVQDDTTVAPENS